MKKYFFNVNDKLKQYISECIKLLEYLKVPDLPCSIYFRECAGKFQYGCCSKGSGKYNEYEYVVAINKYLKKEEDVKSTIIHELVHSIFFPDGHKGRWKQWTKYVDEKTGYNSSLRVSDRELIAYNPRKQSIKNMLYVFCPICGKKELAKRNSVCSDKIARGYMCKDCNMYFYEELPNSPISLFNDKQKDNHLDALFYGEIIFDKTYIANMLPYLNQKLRDKLLYILFKEKTELFLDHHEHSFICTIWYTCTKKMHTVIADMYINGEVERMKNISETEYYNFSSLFSLTKNYIRICAHWETINNVHGVYHGMV